MLSRYSRRPGCCVRRDRVCKNNRGSWTYASLLKDSRSNGITVEASQLGAAASCVPYGCGKAENPAPPCEEAGILRHKDRWEHKEATIFAKHHVLTGIPVFTPPDTLRIVNGECVSLVPLEQVACIRVSDG